MSDIGLVAVPAGEWGVIGHHVVDGGHQAPVAMLQGGFVDLCEIPLLYVLLQLQFLLDCLFFTYFHQSNLLFSLSQLDLLIEKNMPDAL